ncbi:hypothetical protein Hanom_Chr09g00809301 [Helianthus anomalus]
MCRDSLILYKPNLESPITGHNLNLLHLLFPFYPQHHKPSRHLTPSSLHHLTSSHSRTYSLSKSSVVGACRNSPEKTNGNFRSHRRSSNRRNLAETRQGHCSVSCSPLFKFLPYIHAYNLLCQIKKMTN